MSHTEKHEALLSQGTDPEDLLPKLIVARMFNPCFLKFYTCIHSRTLVKPGALGVYTFQIYGLPSLTLYCS